MHLLILCTKQTCRISKDYVQKRECKERRKRGNLNNTKWKTLQEKELNEIGSIVPFLFLLFIMHIIMKSTGTLTEVHAFTTTYNVFKLH